MGARPSMISCTVHDRRKPEAAEDSSSADHSVPVSSPSMSQHNDSLGLAFGLDAPNFKPPSFLGGNGRLGDLPPIRFFLNRIPWDLQDDIRETKADKEIENTHSHNERKESQFEGLHAENEDGMGMALA
jgi:hypothetical protein